MMTNESLSSRRLWSVVQFFGISNDEQKKKTLITP
jgi:hypothetical protein